jgi:DNA polymerase-3 subunit alpha
VRYGLGAVKGTGEQAIAAIEAARAAGGFFRDLGDFCRRIDRRVVNRRAIEALIKAGAFDSIEPNRAGLLASLGAAIALAEKGEQFAQQTSLFGGAEDVAAEAFELMRVPEWPERERLVAEKQSLGFYLSGHPFTAWQDEIRRVARKPLASLQPANEPQMAAGVIYNVDMRNSRRGRMAVLTLDDGSARIEAVVFGELFHEKRAVIQEDQVVVVQGRVSQDDFSGGIRFTADKVMDVAEIRSLYARAIRLSINGQADAAKLRSLLEPHAGGKCAVSIRYRNADGECDIQLPDQYRVKISAPLLASLSDWLTERNVEVVY